MSKQQKHPNPKQPQQPPPSYYIDEEPIEANDEPTKEELYELLKAMRKQNLELQAALRARSEEPSMAAKRRQARDLYRMIKEAEKEDKDSKNPPNKTEAAPTPNPTPNQVTANPAIAHIDGMSEGKRKDLEKGRGWVTDTPWHYAVGYTPANALWNDAPHLALSSGVHQVMSCWKIIELGKQLLP